MLVGGAGPEFSYQAINQATGAEVLGKPAAAFVATAVADLGADAARTVKAGDDIAADVLAAQRQGSPGRWSRPASAFPARIATPSGPLTVSWTPSATCPPR